MELIYCNSEKSLNKECIHNVVTISNLNAERFKEYILCKKTLYFVPSSKNRLLFTGGHEIPSKYKDKRLCIEEKCGLISILQLRQLYNAIGKNISLERMNISIYRVGSFDGFKVIINE